jgi:hypothetical protein
MLSIVSERVEPDAANDFCVGHAQRLLRCYRTLTGHALTEDASDHVVAARALYHAPFVVLSHDSAVDPVFNYANLTAQRCFEMSWPEFVCLPSRFSAEPLARDERQRLLDRVSRRGFIDDYQGVRVSRTGRRFLVSNATVWNLTDEQGRAAGQAATFSTWQNL